VVDRVRPDLGHGRLDGLLVAEVGSDEPHARIETVDRAARSGQAPDLLTALAEQMRREMPTHKAGRSGDQCAHRTVSLLGRAMLPSG
jgi:hypothetical protein